MDYLSLTEILLIHARLVQQTGGAEGVRDLTLLESAVARPKAIFGGENLYPDLWEKAAELMESLIQNHPFVDGNKRSGLAAAGIMLERNGYRFTADNDQVFDLTMSVARGDMRHKKITRWLEESCERLEAV
ncbi:MAG: type II toxin-antitoxin system death-on-curing family toxin [Candidatus Promineifilaceae bacterium]